METDFGGSVVRFRVWVYFLDKLYFRGRRSPRCAASACQLIYTLVSLVLHLLSSLDPFHLPSSPCLVLLWLCVAVGLRCCGSSACDGSFTPSVRIDQMLCVYMGCTQSCGIFEPGFLSVGAKACAGCVRSSVWFRRVTAAPVQIMSLLRVKVVNQQNLCVSKLRLPLNTAAKQALLTSAQTIPRSLTMALTTTTNPPPHVQELDELEWRSPDNPEVAAEVVRDPTANASVQQQQQQQQLGGANNIVTNGNGSVTSVSEISNAVSGDAGPDSRGFPPSSFPDVNGSSPETAELSDSAGGVAAPEAGPVAGSNGEVGGAAGAEGLAAGSEGGVAGGEEEEKDEPPPFLEEFEEVELQVRGGRAFESDSVQHLNWMSFPSVLCGVVSPP